MSRFTEMLTLSLSMLGVLHITRYSAVKVLMGVFPPPPPPRRVALEVGRPFNSDKTTRHPGRVEHDDRFHAYLEAMKFQSPARYLPIAFL
jgi:hypothetical protein